MTFPSRLRHSEFLLQVKKITLIIGDKQTDDGDGAGDNDVDGDDDDDDGFGDDVGDDDAVGYWRQTGGCRSVPRSQEALLS